jgi:hypothetical protein
MYAMLEHEAAEAGLALHWPSHLPDTRRALAVAEWARRMQPRAFPSSAGGVRAPVEVALNGTMSTVTMGEIS